MRTMALAILGLAILVVPLTAGDRAAEEAPLH
jgi:hypothetical protein